MRLATLWSFSCAGVCGGAALCNESCDDDPQTNHTESTELPGEGDTFEKLIIRTWTSLDASANEAVHVQTITVKDTQPPVLVVKAHDGNVNCAHTFIIDNEVLVYDECDESSARCNFDGSGAFACVDGCETTWVRTWEVADSRGNLAQQVQTVVVEDVTAPEWLSQGAQCLVSNDKYATF